MRRLRIQYASDLHLEKYGKNTIDYSRLLKPIAPVLALAGNIGCPGKKTYRELLSYCSRGWDRVFFVAGNREFYNNRDCDQWSMKPLVPIDTFDQRILQIEDIASNYPNVEFLNRTRVDYQGIAFVGASMWVKSIGDDRHIAVDPEGRPAILPDITAWGQRDHLWLQATLDECDQPAVVLTHHPCASTIRSPVHALITGHSRRASYVCWTCPDIQWGINPRGEPGEKGTGYSRERFLEISRKTDYRDPIMVAAME